MVIVAMKLEDSCFLAGKLWQTSTVLKSKDITLLTKVHIVKAIVFSVVMYTWEKWTIKKAEPRRIDAFKLALETFDSPLNSKEIRLVNLKGNQP